MNIDNLLTKLSDKYFCLRISSKHENIFKGKCIKILHFPVLPFFKSIVICCDKKNASQYLKELNYVL